MGFLESLRLALEGLRANKMRAALTMLGIIIGIAAVIGILTVGDGLSSTITGTMSTLGASSITVTLRQTSSDAPGITEDDLITGEMLSELRSRYDADIEAISLTESVGSGQAKDGRLYANLSITGVNEEYFTVNDITLLAGRLIKDRDMEGDRMISVVSNKLVNNLFGGDVQAALGQDISVEWGKERQRFRIVGVYEYEASAFTFSMASEKDISTSMYIPLSSARHLSGGEDGFTNITVQAAENADGMVVAREIQDFLNRYYRRNDHYSIYALSMESMIETVDDMMDTLSIAISVIAAISLLVGGIGVMNIMLVSVTERTREIGTRKALGATNADIRMQFVVESAVICLVGGIFGIILGAVLGYVGSSLLDAPGVLTTQVVGKTSDGDYIHQLAAPNGQLLYFSAMEEEPPVVIRDVNFDGVSDIEVFVAMGASNFYSEFFVYDAYSDVYVRVEHASDDGLSNVELYPEYGLVATYGNAGNAGLLHVWNLYRWEGNDLHLIRSAVSDEWTEDIFEGSTYTQIIHGDMLHVVVRDHTRAYDDAILWELIVPKETAETRDIYTEEMEALWQGIR